MRTALIALLISLLIPSFQAVCWDSCDYAIQPLFFLLPQANSLSILLFGTLYMIISGPFLLTYLYIYIGLKVILSITNKYKKILLVTLFISFYIITLLALHRFVINTTPPSATYVSNINIGMTEEEVDTELAIVHNKQLKKGDAFDIEYTFDNSKKYYPYAIVTALAKKECYPGTKDCPIFYSPEEVMLCGAREYVLSARNHDSYTHSTIILLDNKVIHVQRALPKDKVNHFITYYKPRNNGEWPVKWYYPGFGFIDHANNKLVLANDTTKENTFNECMSDTNEKVCFKKAVPQALNACVQVQEKLTDRAVFDLIVKNIGNMRWDIDAILEKNYLSLDNHYTKSVYGVKENNTIGKYYANNQSLLNEVYLNNLSFLDISTSTISLSSSTIYMVYLNAPESSKLVQVSDGNTTYTDLYLDKNNLLRSKSSPEFKLTPCMSAESNSKCYTNK